MASKSCRETEEARWDSHFFGGGLDNVLENHGKVGCGSGMGPRGLLHWIRRQMKRL